jgi:membrane-associated protease RseP (regulator of RpoE activity)
MLAALARSFFASNSMSFAGRSRGIFFAMEVKSMRFRSLKPLKCCAALPASLCLAVFCGSSLAQQRAFQTQQMNESLRLDPQMPDDDSYTQHPGREHGSLGIALNDNDLGDVVVATVVPSSPADRAGLRPGDQIVAFDYQGVHSYRDAVHYINLKGPYDRLAVRVLRNGRAETFIAQLVPHQLLGPQAAAMVTRGDQPGYFRSKQWQTGTFVPPAPGDYGQGSNPPNASAANAIPNR